MKKEVRLYQIVFMTRNWDGFFDSACTRETDIAFTSAEQAQALVDKLNENGENKKFYVRPIFLKVYEEEKDQDRDSDCLDYRY